MSTHNLCKICIQSAIDDFAHIRVSFLGTIHEQKVTQTELAFFDTKA